MRVGIIGSGMISGRYIGTIQKKFSNLEIVAITSLEWNQCQERAREFGLEPVKTTAELLARNDIELVIVLVPVGAHYEVCRQALEAGKHVYCEKTLTDNPETARELVELAHSRGLKIGAAPDTFLGAGVQTARRAIDTGSIGTVTSFVIAHNRANSFFLPHFPFLQQKGAGILYDYGVYYLTALVSLLGPVDSVFACVESPISAYPNPNDPEHPIVNPNESRVNAIIRMRNGAVGTYQANCDSNIWDCPTFKICGDDGILLMGDCNFFGSPVSRIPFDKGLDDAVPLEMQLPEYAEESRGLGASDMARSIEESGEARATGERACHALDVLTAMLESGRTHQWVHVSSDYTKPEPLHHE